MGDLFTRIFGWFEMPEFIFGMLIGLLLSVLLRFLKPVGDEILDWIQQAFQTVGDKARKGSPDRYQTELLTQAQTSHIAKTIFALDEIIIPPRILAPPIPTDPQRTEPIPESTLAVLPNLPDWTFLSGIYDAPTISLPDALKDGANLMITGKPGSGKTTALAYLAIQAINKGPEAGVTADLVPVLIHASDLQMGRRPEKEPLKPIIIAAQQSMSPNFAPRIPGYLRPIFRQSRALLLLDGLDEMSSEELQIIAIWLTNLQKVFPGNRIVAAGPVQNYGGIARAGLIPVTIAPWSEYELRAFLTQWGQSWLQYIIPNLPKKRIGDIDPALITGWLVAVTRGLTPLELTLRVWAAYVGDVRGAKPLESIAAYIARMVPPNDHQPAEAAALTWINEKQSAVAQKSLRRRTPIEHLVEAGILIHRVGNRVSFAQPAIGAYLAARGMFDAGIPDSATQPGWVPAETALGFYATSGDLSDVVETYLHSTDDQLGINLLKCAHWLRDAPSKMPWRAQVFRALATIASSHGQPYGLRLRAVHALAYTSEADVAILFLRLLTSNAYSSRVLGALGLGGFQHEESIQTLIDTIYKERNILVRQAACLALAAIGTEPALEGLGQILLESEEDVRLAAAEALACHPEEGYNMLRDAAELDNLLTRRAAVFGLARVPEEWAVEILERLQLEDEQWVVRGAAAEAVERRRKPPWKVKPAVEEIAELPWLVDFADREGLGLTPDSSLEMLRRALTKGTPDEQVAALEAIVWAGAEELGLELRQALTASESHLRDAAFETLWHLNAAGTDPITSIS